MTALFVDTSVFLLAAGGEHPDRTASRTFLTAAADSGTQLHVCVEAVQEFVFHRMRRDARGTALEQARQMARACFLHPFDGAVLTEALRLLAETSLRGRDAVHAAAALVAEFDTIVSLDTDSDGLPGITRIHPSEAPL